MRVDGFKKRHRELLFQLAGAFVRRRLSNAPVGLPASRIANPHRRLRKGPDGSPPTIPEPGLSAASPRW